MNAKKAVTWFAVAFVVFYVLTQPAAAGGAVDSLFRGFEDLGNTLAAFVSSIG